MARLLEMRGISKGFPGVRALSEVSISLEAGEVLGVVGENGAGKSTLMKILAGVFPADRGEMRLDGQPFLPRRPRDALHAGIIVIHQELSLIPERSVAENIYLGHLPRGRLGGIRRAELNRGAKALLARVGLQVPPQTRVRQLGIAQQQLVEIARALSRQARVIVMDEPTATLTTAEQRILFATVAILRAAGVGLVFISHHLEEVFALCDRITVLRDGATVDTRPAAAWTKTALIQAMVNRPIEALFPERHATTGEVVLEVEALGSAGRFADVSFSVRAGEVVGIGGLIGAGRTELLKTMAPCPRATAGCACRGGTRGSARRATRSPPGWRWCRKTARRKGWCCRSRCAATSPCRRCRASPGCAASSCAAASTAWPGQRCGAGASARRACASRCGRCRAATSRRSCSAAP